MSRWHLLLSTAALLFSTEVRADECLDVERDGRGECPKRTIVAQPTRIDVRSDVAGTEVAVDGQAVGRTPKLLDVTPGRHLVEVRAGKEVLYSKWIVVAQGKTEVVAIAKPTTCPGDMVRIGGTTFQMGNTDRGSDKDEGPLHAVTLSPYCIDKTEVTLDAYTACVSAGACSAAPHAQSANRWIKPDAEPKWNVLCNADKTHPVNCVDWDQAVAFCGWAKKRLPTEAEWELAARGSDGRTFPWGAEAPDGAHTNGCNGECIAWSKRAIGAMWASLSSVADRWEATAPAGSFPQDVSPYGVLDMAGNVEEWIGDGYAPYGTDAVTNPTIAPSGTTRITRGGSWLSTYPGALSTTRRTRHTSSDRSTTTGFRCARSL